MAMDGWPCISHVLCFAEVTLNMSRGSLMGSAQYRVDVVVSKMPEREHAQTLHEEGLCSVDLGKSDGTSTVSIW